MSAGGFNCVDIPIECRNIEKQGDASSSDSPHVGLFVTGLVDLFRPSVGFAAVKLLEQAGCRVEVSAARTCCGQPAFNSGDDRHARQLAFQVLEAFGDFDYLVAPSGSCLGTIRCHYPEMFAHDASLLPHFEALAAKSHELVGFLVDVLGVDSVNASFSTASLTTTPESATGLPSASITPVFVRAMHDQA